MVKVKITVVRKVNNRELFGENPTVAFGFLKIERIALQKG